MRLPAYCLQTLLASSLVVAWLASNSLSLAEEPADKSESSPPAKRAPLRFDRDVRPILSDKCFHCHGPDEENREADLRLDLEESARVALGDGHWEDSTLIERIFEKDVDLLMPPPEAKKPLTEDEKAVLKRWIVEGANWTQHWSFVPPKFAEQKTATQSAWVRNQIDEFILARLNEQGLKPTAEAEKYELIRRLSYDLTGLPPSLAEIDAFLADESERAYENLVDRLLASKHFGERMAVMWLDAARYGDTSVYHADGPRDMWAWRDTVVKAYNQNMPFDRFSIAQLAGDYLPDATLEEKILGGFNRNNGTTDEGGAFAEEYRVEYCVDRVKTTSTIWLGLTMECAQCHDHKYDPISQEEYYQFYAFFNVSSDGGMQTRNGNAQPTLAVPDPAKEAKLPIVQQQLQDSKAARNDLKSSSNEQFAAWLEKKESEDKTKAETPDSILIDMQMLEGKGKTVAFAQAPEQEPGKAKLHGKVEWVDTPLDKGIKLSGGNYLDLGDKCNFERDQAFSYGGWVKPTKGFGAMLARMDDANAYRGFDLYVGADGVAMHIIHQWPGNAIKVTTKQKLKANEWCHVFATYDGSSKAAGIKIYVNGEEWPWKIEQDGLSDTIQTTKTLLVGSRHPGSRFNGEIDSVQIFDRALSTDEVGQLAKADAITSILAIKAEERSEAQQEKLLDYYLRESQPEYVKLTDQITRMESELVELKKPMTTVMVMRDMGKPRDTFILNRGAYDSPTDRKVEANTIAALPPMADDLPRNRYGLAQWLFSPEQPLTARVTVNRYWQMLFGTGLVNTPQDFGAQGSYPSHPELLDWLAQDFRAHGWNIKRTLKQMVMSATYRQSSRAGEADYRRDPTNQLLGRGPRFRLQAEFIRDASLAVSGLLDTTMGGPGVKPYQPQGLWVEVGLSGKPAFRQDHGNALYRRSLYTYWKRSAPPPTMQIFDAPTREKCTLQRPRTNTPLQALVVLNDPQYVEAARKFAERMMAHSLVANERIKFGFRSVTARIPEAGEVAALNEILASATSQYEDDSEAATKLLSVGESPRDEKFDSKELAAWTVVASTLLNLDETLTRE